MKEDFKVQSFRIANSSEGEKRVWIEPIGDTILIEGGATIEVLATDQIQEVIEITVDDESITLNGWIQSIDLILNQDIRKRIWNVPQA